MYNDWEDEEYCEDDCLYSEVFDEWMCENAPELEEGYQKIKEAITAGVTKAIKQDVVNKMNHIAQIEKKNRLLNDKNWELKQKVSDLERFIRDNQIEKSKDVVLYRVENGWDAHPTCQKCNGTGHLEATLATGEKTKINCPNCRGRGYTDKKTYFISADRTTMYHIDHSWYVRNKDGDFVYYDFERYGYRMSLEAVMKDPRSGGSHVEIDENATYKHLKDFFDRRSYLKKPEWLINEEEKRKEKEKK